MTLQDQIKALPPVVYVRASIFPECEHVTTLHADVAQEWRDAGHVVTEFRAALAAEHDARMQRMVEALKRLLAVQGAVGCTYWGAVKAAQDALREHKDKAG